VKFSGAGISTIAFIARSSANMPIRNNPGF